MHVHTTHQSCLKNLWCADQKVDQTLWLGAPTRDSAITSDFRNSFLI